MIQDIAPHIYHNEYKPVPPDKTSVILAYEQGKILPRRLTGTSQKFQKKVATAVKRARHLAILPFVTDMFK